MSEPSAAGSSENTRGINPLFAVVGASVIALVLVGMSYMIFNRSRASKLSRADSAQKLEDRKDQAKTLTPGNAPAADPSQGPVTDDVINQETKQINQSLKNADQSDQIKSDDLSNQSLGIN